MPVGRNLPACQVDNVYEGKSVFIDWKSGLEPAIYARYDVCQVPDTPSVICKMSKCVIYARFFP